VILLKLENSLLNTEIVLYSLVLQYYSKLLFSNTVCK